MSARPLIESDLLVLAGCLAALGVIALIAWFVERRQWFRDQCMYVDEPPVDDQRNTVVRWNRIQGRG